MEKKPKKDEYRVLTDIEHVLLRPATYIGSIDLNESTEYVFDRKEKKFSLEKIAYIPALRKLIDEPLDNAVDEYTKSNHQFSTKVKLTMTETSVTIEDNGRGIPVERMPDVDMYVPEAMFTLTKAGNNFSDDDRKSMGLNGLGVKLTNIWSRKFEAVTCDGKKQLKLSAKDNNSSHTVKVTDSTKRGTTVSFTPDFERMKIKGFDQTYFDVMYSRLVFLSFLNPGISFYFNGDKIPTVKDKAFISYFTDNFESISSPYGTVAVGSAETFKFLTYVNNLFLSKGGTHVDFVASSVVTAMKTKLEKKHKDIRASDIKNKVFVLAFLNEFTNIRFNSQTKEELTNAAGDVKKYFETAGLDLDRLAASVLKNKDIVFSVEENYKIKEEFEARKSTASGEKEAKKKFIKNYLPPIKDSKYLVLCEGLSASGGISDILGRKEFGYFPLRGKPKCVYEETLGGISKNEELINMCSVLGITMTKDDNVDMAYDYVLIASDQDVDGLHIRGLLIAFFYRFAKTLLKEGRIRFLNTPIMNTKGKDGRPDKWVYRMKDSGVLKGEVFYSKGLGSWKKPDLQHIIAKDGIDKMIQTFELDDGTDASLNRWFGADTSLRKEQLKGLEFSYDSI